MGIANLANGFGAGGGSSSSPTTVPLDTLTSTSTTNPLAANQGRVLKDMIRLTLGQNVTITSNGQTVITLPTTPTDATSVIVEINGVDYHPTTDFTVAGAIVTWVGAFTIAISDVAYVSYI